MSEIEKLYENASIKPKPLFSTRYGYEEGNYIMPVFTAEKQLELIKWLITNAHCSFIFSIKPSEFTEYLAKNVNYIWQDLTDTERTEIKRILE